MKASVGDWIVIVSSATDHRTRDGRIWEVRGPDGGPPYLVAWSDGHEGLIFPGPDAHVQHLDPHGRTVDAAPPVVRERRWQVNLAIVEQDGRTTAHATLVGDGPVLETDGGARCNPADDDVPLIGGEVAAARALRRLADALLAEAATGIGAAEGTSVVLQPR
jgi:hypothetical protein